MEYKHLSVYLRNLRAVTEEYAKEHTEELLKAVNRGNEAVFVQNDEDMAILVPYWWYMQNFGNNVQMIVEYLFEECREQNATDSMINLGIADGYLSHVSRMVGQEIRESLMDKMNGHPYAVQWQEMLDRWAGKWKENTAKELWLVMAKFAGDRKIYLLYQNGATRLLDGRTLIGHGLKAVDLEDESVFCDRITMTSGALLWMSEEDRIMWAVSSDELLELSIPVAPDEAKEIWKPQRVKR